MKLKLSPDGPAEDIFGKLDDTRFTLVVFGQPAPAAGLPDLSGFLRVLVIPTESGNDGSQLLCQPLTRWHAGSNIHQV